MPVLKNSTILQLAKNLRAFLNLEVGLTHARVQDYERVLEQTRRGSTEREQQLEQNRRSLREKDRQLKEMRGRLAVKNQQIAALQASVALELKNGQYDSELYSEVAAVLDLIPADFGGGCSLSKAYMLAWLIRRYDLRETVDIGVYRGRSLFPQALAHRRFTGGVVYGVDPWSASEAKEWDINHEDKEGINRFIEQTDWQAIYQEVEAINNQFHYEKHCVLLRQASADAATYFENNTIFFDMIHVDGNHDTGKVTKDIELYVPRLRESGFIVLDDISWESVRPAYDILNTKMTLVFERVDHNRMNDYAVFWNDTPLSDTKYNHRLWSPRIFGESQ